MYSNDTLKGHILIAVGSTVAFEREDSGLWMHDMITDHGDSDHNNRYHKNKILRWGMIVARTARCIKTTPISTE